LSQTGILIGFIHGLISRRMRLRSY